jgi:hypothetical protein
MIPTATTAVLAVMVNRLLAEPAITPTLHWPTAVITDILPQADGTVRVVTHRNPKGTETSYCKISPLQRKKKWWFIVSPFSRGQNVHAREEIFWLIYAIIVHLLLCSCYSFIHCRHNCILYAVSKQHKQHSTYPTMCHWVNPDTSQNFPSGSTSTPLFHRRLHLTKSRVWPEGRPCAVALRHFLYLI